MLAECVIEPEVMAQWRHFQSLEEDFGVRQARMICEFPSKWRRAVIQRSQSMVSEGKNTELQRKRMIEIMTSERFRRKLIPAGHSRSAFDPDESWLANARRALPSFDLIIKASSGKDGSEVCADELIKSEPPFFRSTQNWVQRTRTDLINAAELLLRNCSNLVLVEPNFRADETRFSYTTIELFERVEELNPNLKTIELHTQQVRSRDEVFNATARESVFRRYLSAHVPRGCALHVFHWSRLPDGNRLHPRFLLTNQGGLHFDYGIDESPSESTLVSSLDDHIAQGLVEALKTTPRLECDRHSFVII